MKMDRWGGYYSYNGDEEKIEGGGQGRYYVPNVEESGSDNVRKARDDFNLIELKSYNFKTRFLIYIQNPICIGHHIIPCFH